MMYIFTNHSTRAGYDTRSIFKRSLTGLNSEFSFSYTSCFTKAEEPSLPYYLPMAGGRIIGYIPFPRVLVLCEMQSVSSRIWTSVAVSISYDDNNCTTGTFWTYDVVWKTCQERWMIGTDGVRERVREIHAFRALMMMIYTCISRVMVKLMSKLRKMIMLSDVFSKITCKYIEILWIKFIQRDRHWLQSP